VEKKTYVQPSGGMPSRSKEGETATSGVRKRARTRGLSCRWGEDKVGKNIERPGARREEDSGTGFPKKRPKITRGRIDLITYAEKKESPKKRMYAAGV